MKQLLIIGTLCITGLSACNTTAVDEIARRSSDQCYFEKITPAEISTQVETRLVQPEKRNTAGQLVSPAQYETTRTQTITKPRRYQNRRRLPEDLTPNLLPPCSGHFRHVVCFSPQLRDNGHTHTARHFEFSNCSGVESATVMKATAQELGLVVIDP